MADSSGYKEYLAGLIAGVATVGIGHPFDTVKVKMQKHNTSAQGITYRNSLHCTARVLRTEGIKGLYRGATSSFVGMAFESSLLFGMYSQMKQSLQGSAQGVGPQPQVIIPSAAYSGAVISFILCPSELVKCRMQIQGTDSVVPMSRRYGSPLDCALTTVKNDGRNFSRRLYNIAKRRNLIDVGVGIASGGLGGIAFWLAVLPLDVAKTIIQTTQDKNSSRNPFHILSSIYRSAGLKGCYIGLGPTIVRAFPANAAAIVTWEVAIKLLGIKRD
nr:mitochondrial arginine transporter BAC1-like isoform X2 [Malus domestica]